MENKKFRVVEEKDENGKPVRKFVPYDENHPEPECPLYGNCAFTDEDHIQETKDMLLSDLLNTIKELAKKNNFWIVKRVDEHDPLVTDGCPEAFRGKAVTVAWKIEIPQFGE